MNNDIKEILDNIKKCCEIMQDENFVVYQKQDIIKLLDYITNLQQENEELKKIIKENTILVKDENGNYQECNINPLDYKSRCEKANAYMDYYWISYEDSKKDENYEDELEVLVREIYDLYCILNGKE